MRLESHYDSMDINARNRAERAGGSANVGKTHKREAGSCSLADVARFQADQLIRKKHDRLSSILLPKHDQPYCDLQK